MVASNAIRPYIPRLVSVEDVKLNYINKQKKSYKYYLIILDSERSKQNEFITFLADNRLP